MPARAATWTRCRDRGRPRLGKRVPARSCAIRSRRRSIKKLDETRRSWIDDRCIAEIEAAIAEVPEALCVATMQGRPTTKSRRLAHGQSPRTRQTPQVDPQHPQDHADDGVDRHGAVQEGHGPRHRRHGLHQADHGPGGHLAAAAGSQPSAAGARSGDRRRPCCWCSPPTAACAAATTPTCCGWRLHRFKRTSRRSARGPAGSRRQARHRGLPLPQDSRSTSRSRTSRTSRLSRKSTCWPTAIWRCTIAGELDRLDVAYTQFESVSAAVRRGRNAAAAGRLEGDERRHRAADGRSTSFCLRPRASWKRSCRPASR